MVSPTLQRAIDAAVAQVYLHARHALRPYYRNAIYVALSEPHKARGDYLRYGWLMIITARHVLPLWQQWKERSRPDDTRAERLLAEAEQVLRGSHSAQGVGAVANEAWLWAMGSTSITEQGEIPPRPVMSAFMAIAKAGMAIAELVTALDAGQLDEGDESTRENALGVEDEDADITDPESADVPLWADDALTQPGFRPLAEEYDARLAFWTWWLTEAVPQAWEAGA